MVMIRKGRIFSRGREWLLEPAEKLQDLLLISCGDWFLGSKLYVLYMFIFLFFEFLLVIKD